MYKLIRKASIQNAILASLIFLIPCGIIFGINTIARGANITKGDVVCFVLSGVFLLVVLCFVFYIILGMDVKPIKKKIQDNSWEKDSVEQDLLSGYQDKHVLVGQKYIAHNSSWKCHIYSIHDVIWAYQFSHISVSRRSSIFRRRETNEYQVILTFRDGNTSKIPMKSPEEAQNLIKYLKKMHPHIILGYSERIQQVCQNNFSEFVRMVDEGIINNTETDYLR